jgi:E3 ubiquitin-protein ligase CHFR
VTASDCFVFILKNSFFYIFIFVIKLCKQINEYSINECSNNDDDEEDITNNQFDFPAPSFAYNFPLNNQLFGSAIQSPLFSFNPSRCRQCTPNPQSSNSLNYTCSMHQNHLLCQCCLEPYPDRSYDLDLNSQTVRKQRCSMCFKSYCNLYWGCLKSDCKKCLINFIDIELDDKSMTTIINENKHESKLFKKWLEQENKTLKDVFNDCIHNLIIEKYTISRVDKNTILDRVVCRQCGLSLVRDLIYQFREELPEESFLESGRRRPNCFYGRMCRTQKHNEDHAK